MAWARIYDKALDDPRVQRLSAYEFKRQFIGALQGEKNAWSPWIRPGNDRPPAYEWRRLRTAVFHRDDYTCTYCGARGVRLECDHIVPISRGGSNDIENLATACFTCNRSKRDKLVEEWLV